MGKLLQLIWICKVLLTGGTAWRYCSENVLSPFCYISGFYSFALFLSIFITYRKRNGFTILEEQEGLRLQQLEEGIAETFVSVEQNGPVCSSVRSDKCEWQDFIKEKYS